MPKIQGGIMRGIFRMTALSGLAFATGLISVAQTNGGTLYNQLRDVSEYIVQGFGKQPG
jgi:hypothetical protein